jgi:hypothetical protein
LAFDSHRIRTGIGGNSHAFYPTTNNFSTRQPRVYRWRSVRTGGPASLKLLVSTLGGVTALLPASTGVVGGA